MSGTVVTVVSMVVVVMVMVVVVMGSVGAADGEPLAGELLGAAVGLLDGGLVGTVDAGDSVGASDGADEVGVADGEPVGAGVVGDTEGPTEGDAVGTELAGDMVGSDGVGNAVGDAVDEVGKPDGALDGADGVGDSVGSDDAGEPVGDDEYRSSHTDTLATSHRSAGHALVVKYAHGGELVGAAVGSLDGVAVGDTVQTPQANGQYNGRVVITAQNPFAAREVQLVEAAKPGTVSASMQTIGEAVGGGAVVGSGVQSPHVSGHAARIPSPKGPANVQYPDPNPSVHVDPPWPSLLSSQTSCIESSSSSPEP